MLTTAATFKLAILDYIAARTGNGAKSRFILSEFVHLFTKLVKRGEVAMEALALERKAEQNRELRERLMQLKKERNAIILAHYYQRDEIQEVADFRGDSFLLAQ